tara:strand:- start:686 stop:862 length:177 start_codon:yes stop_codon:yes gene_type:complete
MLNANKFGLMLNSRCVFKFYISGTTTTTNTREPSVFILYFTFFHPRITHHTGTDARKT